MIRAVHFLKQMSEDDKLREAARICERALHDEASYIQDAIEDGMAIGVERGRVEGINAVIKAMKAAGMDTAQIEKLNIK